MPAMWRLGGLTVKELARCVWKEIDKDDVFGQAAKLSFYFLLAVFPLLLFATTIFGYFAQGEEFRRTILEQCLRRLIQAGVARVVLATTTNHGPFFWRSASSLRYSPLRPRTMGASR